MSDDESLAAYDNMPTNSLIAEKITAAFGDIDKAPGDDDDYDDDDYDVEADEQCVNSDGSVDVDDVTKSIVLSIDDIQHTVTLLEVLDSEHNDYILLIVESVASISRLSDSVRDDGSAVVCCRKGKTVNGRDVYIHVPIEMEYTHAREVAKALFPSKKMTKNLVLKCVKGDGNNIVGGSTLLRDWLMADIANANEKRKLAAKNKLPPKKDEPAPDPEPPSAFKAPVKPSLKSRASVKGSKKKVTILSAPIVDEQDNVRERTASPPPVPDREVLPTGVPLSYSGGVKEDPPTYDSVEEILTRKRENDSVPTILLDDATAAIFNAPEPTAKRRRGYRVQVSWDYFTDTASDAADGLVEILRVNNIGQTSI